MHLNSLERPRWVEPLPRAGLDRLHWLADLDEAISVECLALAALMVAQGASRVATIDLLEGFYGYLTARLRAVVDDHVLAELQAAA